MRRRLRSHVTAVASMSDRRCRWGGGGEDEAAWCNDSVGGRAIKWPHLFFFLPLREGGQAVGWDGTTLNQRLDGGCTDGTRATPPNADATRWL